MHTSPIMRATGRRVLAAIVGTVLAAGLMTGALAGDTKPNGSLAKAATSPCLSQQQANKPKCV